MRILRLLCGVALAGGLAFSLAALAQEIPKGGAFGGGGTGGGGAAFGADPDVVDGKRIHYGEITEVKIAFQPGTLLTEEMIRELLFSDRVWHAAVLDIGGQPNPDKQNRVPVFIVDGAIVNVSPTWGGASYLQDKEHITNGVVFVQMGAGVSRTKADLEKFDEAAVRSKMERIAGKFFAALRKRLEKELTAITCRQFDREIERQRKSVEQELALAEEANERVAKKREELRRLESGVPQQVLAETVANLQKHRQQLELDLAGMKGRAEALQEEVAKVAERVKKEPADDEVLQNLMRVIELRKDQRTAARALHEMGAAGGEQINVLKAEEQIALAQVELAQAKRAVTRTAAEQLEKLNSDLAQLAISKAEAESKLDYVKGQLERYSELLRRETQKVQPAREKLAIEADAAQTMLAEANRRLVELRRMEASFRPASVETFSIEKELKLEPKPKAANDDEPAKKP